MVACTAFSLYLIAQPLVQEKGPEQAQPAAGPAPSS